MLSAVLALGAMNSVCSGAQFLTFPVTGPADTAVSTGWTTSDPMGDRNAWYNSIGAASAISVGAYYDDYAGVGGDFYIDHAMSPTVALTDTVLSLNFTITDFDEFAIRNNYSFSLLSASSANLATVNFTNAPGVPFWNISINGNAAFVAVEEGGNYTLNLSFSQSGADANYSAILNSFTDSGVIAGGAAESIGHVRIGANLGAGNTEFGDGFITVTAVPEPGSLAMLSLVPVFCLLRRRRS